MIDLRSDTVTKPGPGMRAAMAAADVGDDIYGEDPTVRALEELVAELTGKEEALFVPSGTMGNQVCLMVLTRRGDEVIIGEGAHCAFYESGAGGAIAGVQFVEAGRGGLFDEAAVEDAIKPEAFYHPRTSVVALENTHNRAGGRVFPQATVERVARLARSRGLSLHLDGARIWNAATATGLSVAALAAPFDTVSVCFSKGLGAPVGSAVCSTSEHITLARRYRKMLGGAMRQVGILAAAAKYAIEHHRQRIAEDHENARALAEACRALRGLDVQMPETNIVNIETPGLTASGIAESCRTRGLLINASARERLRAVAHLDFDASDVPRAAALLAEALDEARAKERA
jgi:threonine aldolase